MGRIAYADILLDANLNAILIGKILSQGVNLGLQYYIYNTKKGFTEEHSLSVNEACVAVIEELSNPKDIFFNPFGSIDFNMHDNHGELKFFPKQYSTRISLIAHGSPWYINNHQDYDIVDWNLYIALLLELCKDFAVLELSSHDENFNWD